MDRIGKNEIESILFERGFSGAKLDDIAEEIMQHSSNGYDVRTAIDLAYRVTDIDPK